MYAASVGKQISQMNLTQIGVPILFYAFCIVLFSMKSEASQYHCSTRPWGETQQKVTPCAPAS